LTDPSQHAAVSSGTPATVAWIATLIWAAVIFTMSTGTYGASFTAQALAWLLDLFHLHLSPRHFATLHFFVRKLAHLTEYGFFAFLLYHALLGNHPNGWHLRTAAWAVVIAGLYSLTDELHQTFVHDRTPALHDCGIDTVGAGLAMLMVYGANRVVQARQISAAAAPASPAERKNGVDGE
jgi:VanZ family protein